MKILQTRTFANQVKKLHTNQKNDLDEAIREIIDDLFIGKPKKGDLNGVSVYKFKMTKQLTLLAYEYDSSNNQLTLLALGSHENFYRDLKH